MLESESSDDEEQAWSLRSRWREGHPKKRMPSPERSMVRIGDNVARVLWSTPSRAPVGAGRLLLGGARIGRWGAKARRVIGCATAPQALQIRKNLNKSLADPKGLRAMSLCATRHHHLLSSLPSALSPWGLARRGRLKARATGRSRLKPPQCKDAAAKGERMVARANRAQDWRCAGNCRRQRSRP